MGLLDSKTRSVVGLDIEPGFLAAAEFSNGGSPALVRAATETPRPRPLPRGRGRRRRRACGPRQGLLPGARPAQADPPRGRQPEDRAARARAAGDQERAGARGRRSLPGPGGASDAPRAGGARLPRAGARRQRRGRPHARRRRRRPPRHASSTCSRSARKAGLQPELVDLSAFAMIRALYVPPGPAAEALAAAEVAPDAGARPRRPADRAAPEQRDGEAETAVATETETATATATAVQEPATLYCYVGGLTNLAIGVGESCVFNRVLQNGVESDGRNARRAARSDARPLARVAPLCGPRSARSTASRASARSSRRRARCCERGASRIADEIRLSIEYYHTTVPDARRVETTVMAGPGIAIEGLAAFFEQELGHAGPASQHGSGRGAAGRA